jgi:hypothetical protein
MLAVAVAMVGARDRRNHELDDAGSECVRKGAISGLELQPTAVSISSDSPIALGSRDNGFDGERTIDGRSAPSRTIQPADLALLWQSGLLSLVALPCRLTLLEMILFRLPYAVILPFPVPLLLLALLPPANLSLLLLASGTLVNVFSSPVVRIPNPNLPILGLGALAPPTGGGPPAIISP